jgi:hypothetical protein
MLGRVKIRLLIQLNKVACYQNNQVVVACRAPVSGWLGMPRWGFVPLMRPATAAEQRFVG